MSDITMLATGMAFGLSIAAPVGPIGLLCIRRTLAGGALLGFATGLGAAVADGLYGLVAALGITAVAGFLARWEVWLKLGGGLFLIWLGIAGWRAGVATERPAPSRGGLLAAFATTFGLTLTNPSTILSFIAIFGSLGASAVAGGGVVPLVAGVFLGSALWWLFLSTTVGMLHRRLPAGAVIWINRGAALALIAFGAVALASLVLPWA